MYTEIMPDEGKEGGIPDDVKKLLEELGGGGGEKTVEQPHETATSKKEQTVSKPVGGGKRLLPDDIKEVPMFVRVELGRTKMTIGELLRLDVGTVVELDKLTSDLLNIYVNDKLVARGEIRIDGENLVVRVVEIVDQP